MDEIGVPPVQSDDLVPLYRYVAQSDAVETFGEFVEEPHMADADAMQFDADAMHDDSPHPDEVDHEVDQSNDARSEPVSGSEDEERGVLNAPGANADIIARIARRRKGAPAEARPTTRAARALVVETNKLAGFERRRRVNTASQVDVAAMLAQLRRDGFSESRITAIRNLYSKRRPCEAACLLTMHPIMCQYIGVQAPLRSANVDGNRSLLLRDSKRDQKRAILTTLFTPLGVAMHCTACIKTCFGTSFHVLADIAAGIKEDVISNGWELVPKGELIDKQPWRLRYIRIHGGEDAAAAVAEWEDLPYEALIEARRFAGVHGLKGRESNRHRQLVASMELMSLFITNNSTPSGRTTDSGAQFYMADRFSRWSTRTSPHNTYKHVYDILY